MLEGLQLPLIRRIEISHLATYAATETVDEEVSKPVFCLVGANGLGKSTFIATVNYGLTGIVPSPSRNFESVGQFARENRPYAQRYFEGRVDELDRELAEISLSFSLGEASCYITRSLVDADDIRELELTNAGERTGTYSPEDGANEIYQEFVIEHSGLKNFDQFVFLQHLVLTFDERRVLLFWNQRLASPALHLAFGVNPEEASRADQLQDEANKAGSRVRNLQWQATQVRRSMSSLRKQADKLAQDDLPGEIVSQQRELVQAVGKIEAAVRAAEADIDDVELQRSRTAAKRARARSDYEQAFDVLFVGSTDPSFHPTVLELMRLGTCPLCRTSDEAAKAHVVEELTKNNCPMCASSVPVTAQSELPEELNKWAEKTRQADEEYRAVLSRSDRLRKQLRDLDQALEDARGKVVEFEKEHGLEAGSIQIEDPESVEAILASYQHQYDVFMTKKAEQRLRREKALDQLRSIEQGLRESYANAEKSFVPEFRKLAESFLGLAIDVRLQESADGIHLVLEVDGSPRRAADALSESQRYFVDIALRMALIRQMARSNPDPAGLLIVDTPEGALDIAYESRAGEMFSHFSDQGFRMLITANINTSRLLLRLAQLCGRDRMQLVRMTNWASLSAVQVSEEQLFDEAFESIEDALTDGG